MRIILSTLCVFWYQLPFAISSLEANSESLEPIGDIIDAKTQKEMKLMAEAKQYVKRFKEEADRGNKAELFGTNRHYYIPNNYAEFGRRFVPVYPYYEKEPYQIDEEAEKRLDEAVKAALKNVAKDQDKLTPVKASPELVLAVARQSLLRERARPKNDDDERLQKEILRSGDYWNGVWKEDVPDPVKQPLRTSNRLESVQVKILPGSKIYNLVKMTKDLSPRLLYVINQ